MIAIYTRQSIDKKDSISIEGQVEQCRKEIGDEKFIVYTDKGFSGKNIKRPDFENMMKAIENGKVSKVVVYRLDRISRSITDFASIIQTLQSHDVDFISATEKFDTSTAMGRAMLYIIMVFAQLERETIAERIKDNYYLRGKNGYFAGGNTPFGYKSERATINGKQTSVLTVDPQKADILIKIFELYSNSNMSLGDVQKYLISNNIKSSQGANWDSMKISRILRNPAAVKADADIYSYYTNKGCIVVNEPSEFTGKNGCILFGKRDRSAGKYTDLNEHILAIGQQEGIIDSFTFLQCQYKLDNNKQIKNTGKGKYTWLTGLVKCANCGYSMSVSKYKDVRYLKCSGRYNYKTCDVDYGTHYLDDIEAHVEKLLIKRLKELNLENKMEAPPVDDFEVNQFKLQLIDIETQIENLINQLAKANDVVMDYINKKVFKLEMERKELLEKISLTNLKNKSKDAIYEIAESIDEWDTFDIDQRKDIAQFAIEKVSVGDKIEIVFKV